MQVFSFFYDTRHDWNFCTTITKCMFISSWVQWIWASAHRFHPNLLLVLLLIPIRSASQWGMLPSTHTACIPQITMMSSHMEATGIGHSKTTKQGEERGVANTLQLTSVLQSSDWNNCACSTLHWHEGRTAALWELDRRLKDFCPRCDLNCVGGSPSPACPCVFVRVECDWIFWAKNCSWKEVRSPRKQFSPFP